MMAKLKEHFSSKKAYYITAIIILLLMNLCYSMFGIYPFGSKTIASGDTYSQIIPFLGLIRDAIDGRSTIVFSNYIAGGANIVGYLCYFIFSPFYLLVLPFPKDVFIYVMSFVYIIQIECIAIIFLWFIRKYFRLSNIEQIIFTILYTLSPYVIFNYSWFSWMYIYMLMPLLVHYFIKLIRTGKVLGFLFVVTSMIYNCYGVGLMSQVLIFTLLTLFTILMFKDKERKKTILNKVFLTYGIAMCLALPMLVINFLQLQESSRLGSFFSEFWNKGLFESFNYDICYIVSDVFTLMLSIMYIVKCNKKSPFSQFMIVALLLNFIPIIIDGVTLMLSLGSYYGFNMRMGFVLTFLMTISSIQNYKQLKRNSTCKDIKTDKKTIYKYLIAIGLLVALFVGVFIVEYDYLVRLSMTVLNNNLTSFISIILYIIPMSLLIWLVMFVLRSKNKGIISQKFFLSIVILIVSLQLIINPTAFIKRELPDTDVLSIVQELSDELDIDGEKIKAASYIDSNMHLLTNFSSMSGFASQINENITKFNLALGYYTGGAFGRRDGFNDTTTHGGNLLTDSFLGYKYYLYTYPVDYPWMNFITKKTEGKKTYYLYENTLSLNNAILVDKDSQLELLDGFSLENTQRLYEYLGGTGDIFKSTLLVELLDENDVYNLEYEGKKLSVEVSSSSYDRVLYLTGPSRILKNPYIVRQEKEFVYPESISMVGYIPAGSEYSFEVDSIIEEDFEEIYLVEMDYNLVLNLLASLQTQTVDFEYTKDGFKFETNSSNQKIVVTNINLDGYNITCNDHAVTLADNLLLEFELDNGENIVNAQYKFPYIKALLGSIAISFVGIIALLVIFKFAKTNKVVKNTIYYSAISFFSVLLIVFYLVPNCIFLVRLCILRF